MNPQTIFQWLVIASSFGFITATTAAPSGEKDAEGFVSIFAGKTLNGWEVKPAKESKAWKVRDGMIVGSDGQKRSHLVFENKQLADFEIKLSYRFPGKGHSGISIRAREDKTGQREFQSYHVGIGKHILGA